ncbi:wD repeat domain, partial [Mortierella sp. AD032]
MQGVSKSEVSLDALYKHIFDNWVEVGKRRLISKDMNRTEREAFEEINEYGFEIVCMTYLLSLAVAIFKHQKDVSFVEYKPRDPAKWKAKFFGTDPKSKLLQESVPLTRSGSSYRFIHPSLLKYLHSLLRNLYSQVVFDPNGSAKGGDDKELLGADDSSSDGSGSGNPGWGERNNFLGTGTGTALERGSEPQRAQGPQRNPTVGRGQLMEQSQAYKQGQVLEQSRELPLGLEQENMFKTDHKLRKTGIDARSIIRILVYRVRNSPGFKSLVVETVRRSSSSPNNTLAANAITVLIESGMRFNGADLRGIKIKGANLTGGDFDSADLRDSDLREVIFGKCWLRGARLEGARLTGVKFGEFGKRMVKLEDTPITAGYSSVGEHYVVVFDCGSIVVYDTTTWETTYLLEDFASGITTVAFSPDGEHLAFGDMDGILRTWMFKKTPKAPVLSADHNDCISEVAYSPDGLHIATACQEGIVRILDASSGQCVKKLSDHLGVSCIAFSPDGNLLVSGSSNKTIRLWDLKSGQIIHIFEGHEDAISKVLFSPNGTQIASSSSDKTVRTWSTLTKGCEAIFHDHSKRVTSIAYSPCGNQLISCSEDNTIRMWDSRSGSAGPIFRGHKGHVISAALSPDGKQLASCGIDKTIQVLDYWAGNPETNANGQTYAASSGMFPYSTVKRNDNDGDKTIQPTLLRPCWVAFVFDSFPDRVTNVTVSPDGTLVASASKKVVNVRNKGTQLRLIGHTRNVNCIVFSPDNQHIASGSSDQTTRVWDASSGACVNELKGHKGAVMSIAFSSAGHQIVTGSEDGTVRLWNLVTGETLNIFGQKVGVDILSVAFSSNGKYIASGSEDGAVRIWDAVDYKETSHVYYHGGVINCIVFSPDNIHIASGGDDGTISIWNMDTKDTERVIRHGGVIKCLAYSSTGENIASGGDDQYVRIWTAATGATDSTLDHNNSVLSLSYSTDGTQIWMGSADYKVYAWADFSLVSRTDTPSTAEFSKDCRQVAWNPDGKGVQLWSMDSGTLERTLGRCSESIEHFLFSSVHNIIATSSRDGMVKLWDSQTGECLESLEGHTGGVAKIMFSPDGMQILTYSGMKLRQWALSITRSETPLKVGEQGVRPQTGCSSSGVDGPWDQQNAPLQETKIFAAILAVHDVDAVTVPVYSPDGREISVSTAYDVVERFGTQSGKSLLPLVGPSGIVTCIAYSLSGDTIATGGEDKTVRIWDRETVEPKLQLSGHKKRINSIAFSPCGKQVATGSDDTTIRLWNSIFHGPGTELVGQGGPILCVAYSPDGRFLVSGNEDRLMRLWDPTTGALLDTVGDFVAGVKSIRWKTTRGGL